MNRLWQSFLLLLATATDRELARQIQFIKAENRILRDKLPRRIEVTPTERRRLLRFGKPLGSAIRNLICIVSPRTFARWLSGEGSKRKPGKAGRPRTREDIAELVIRLARETGWGSLRIYGELKKLGVRKVSKSTIVRMLREHGFDPGPKRGEGTWDEFIKRHAKTLWACDFFTKKAWTARGLVEFYVLFFLHIGSRRVHVAGFSANPDRQWIAQQARNTSIFFGELPDKPTILIRDQDGKFSPEFDAILRSDGIHVEKVGPRKPNLNAFAERWVQSVKRECLDHFVVFGEAHLRHLISEYVEYYNQERPHQRKENLPLSATRPPEPLATGKLPKIVCDRRLGGLLRHYRHVA